jgi:hypothetical protein
MLFALFALLYMGLLCISQSATRVYIGAFDLDGHHTISPFMCLPVDVV